MNMTFQPLTNNFTQESLADKVGLYIDNFTGSTITIFTKFKNIVTFAPINTGSDIVNQTATNLNDVKNIDKGSYRDLMDIKVPTIIGLKTTLPSLVTTLESNMKYIEDGKTVDKIITSVRKFLTKPDHRLDVSRSDIDISKATDDLKKRIERLGEHFDIDSTTDTTEFKKLFGNINTFKASGYTLLDMTIITSGDLLKGIDEQYKAINGYVDELSKIALDDNENILSKNLSILISELEFCANYFTFASQVISLSRSANDIYLKVTNEIK